MLGSFVVRRLVGKSCFTAGTFAPVCGTFDLVLSEFLEIFTFLNNPQDVGLTWNLNDILFVTVTDFIKY